MTHGDEKAEVHNGAEEKELEDAIEAELDEEDRTAPAEEAVVEVLLRDRDVHAAVE